MADDSRAGMFFYVVWFTLFSCHPDPGLYKYLLVLACLVQFENSSAHDLSSANLPSKDAGLRVDDHYSRLSSLPFAGDLDPTSTDAHLLGANHCGLRLAWYSSRIGQHMIFFAQTFYQKMLVYMWMIAILACLVQLENRSRHDLFCANLLSEDAGLHVDDRYSRVCQARLRQR
ncbi:hypothetical protein L6452_31956 [Arctium lappa]|uniref:Uncharacterized protein n=1 Tax=Arctium lappa TaxID=4217 RepID=A0ACB8Z2Y8_ARCLA|nr:hypothetical protein L6452_31956 [Arctium lappa]